MKRNLYFLFLLLSFILLGCGGDIKISIYTRDLSEVADSKENIIYTNANMIVESLDDEKDIEFLRQNLNGFSNEHAVQYNYSTSLSFDIKVPIVSDENSINFSKDLLSLICKKNNDEINCYLKYNKNLISKIQSYIYSAHYQSIDLSEFKLKLEINNDERKNRYFTSYSSYVNGTPYPFVHEDPLNERDRISLEVSEIFTNYISSLHASNYPLFTIK